MKTLTTTGILFFVIEIVLPQVAALAIVDYSIYISRWADFRDLQEVVHYNIAQDFPVAFIAISSLLIFSRAAVFARHLLSKTFQRFSS